nr:inorganic phosphate transporter [Prevotella sp.]
METIYFCIVVFLLCLAVFDLFVGVSNDAVNFLQSAIGAKVAKFRTVLIIASFGVVVGAIMSSGMMDVARHGIIMPSEYSFEEVMTIFLAVMVTDVIILDVFNTLGMPTSTTVSLVFELLGGAFVIATIKMISDGSLGYGMLLNTDKALSVIVAIFVSVAIAFVFGVIVMWLSRLVFTFNYKHQSQILTVVFGGIAFTALSYFIFLKGLGKSPYISATVSDYISVNTGMLIVYTFVASTIIMQIMHWLGCNIFKFVVLMGTFALAMAFAGNDLVNFIGVPLAGLDSFNDFVTNANGASASSFHMGSLMASAKTPPLYLLGAGVIMIIAMAKSKKAHNVIKTSIDLSRQDEGDEMFGSSKTARSIVRFTQNSNNFITKALPVCVTKWIDSRFNKRDMILENESAAFDIVRAAVNLVLASMLITIGTNYKLPLSTTYVTFMVAMGSSLADRAWSRESAVFRVTGVISVIGGWFITAGLAFIACALVCLLMYYGGIIAKVVFMAAVVITLIRSNRNFSRKSKETENEDNAFRLMMRSNDPEIVWDLLRNHVSRTQSYVNRFALSQYNKIIEGLAEENVRELGKCTKQLKTELQTLKKYRRQEMLALKKLPFDIAIERNTWFHLGANSDQQFIYSLRRMLEPIKEHVDNNFNPLPAGYITEYSKINHKVNDLMKQSEAQISTGRYDNYRDILSEADTLKNQLSSLRKIHIDRIQCSEDDSEMQINMVYLNLLQETQEFMSAMRHQLRAAKKFIDN